MRIAIAALALALAAACSPAAQPAAETPEDASAGSSGVANVADAPFTLESEALVGLWSFARHCGDYDLVFQADGAAQHYVVSPEGMTTSYAGTWATADNNRVVLTLHRVGEHNARLSEDVIYNLDVAATVTDDLIGRFSRADGAEAQDITARRCPEEDRD
jgi:hypothetical protein